MRGFSSIFIGICLTSIPGVALAAPADIKSNAKVDKSLPVAPAVGIKVPGIQIPFSSVKSEVEVPVATPGTVTVSEAVFVPSASKDQVVRIDTKTGDPKPVDPKSADAKPADTKTAAVNAVDAKPAAEKPATDAKAEEPKTTVSATDAPPAGAAGGSGGGSRGGRGGGGGMGGGPPKPLDPIAGVSKPCANAIVAFGSLWVPNCGTNSITRHDTKTNKVTATLAIGAFDALNAIASTADSVWMFTDNKTTLSRVDPASNKVVGELRLPANCNDLVSGDSSLWVSCPGENRILRVNPNTNLVINRIEVSAAPRSAVFGAGSIWVLCEKDGKIERIDPKTNKVIKTIDLAVPHAGGNLAFGDGFLWVTQAGFPLTRIDTTSEKEHVAQQFWGEGGGTLAVTTGALWLTDTAKGKVERLDPKRIVATLAE